MLGPIGLAVLTFIGYKQTKKKTSTENIYIYTYTMINLIKLISNIFFYTVTKKTLELVQLKIAHSRPFLRIYFYLENQR